MEEKSTPGCEQTTLTRAFCVSLSAEHKTQKMPGMSLAEFQKVISTSALSWVNCSVHDVNKGAAEVARALGFSQTLVTALLSAVLSAYEDLDIEMGLRLPAVLVAKFDVEVTPLIILMRKGLIVTIHSEYITRLEKFSRYCEIFMRKILPDAPWNDKISLMLMRILEENNERNFDGLRSIEEQGDEIGKFLLDPKTPRTQIAPEIYKMKHALITYLSLLWETRDVLHSIRYGDAEVITDNNRLLQRISIIDNDVMNQISLSEHMSDVLASGLEVLQTIYNNQLQILNNRLSFVMVWLTILGTAVLVPNTLATVLSNQAFNMKPSDAVWYSILIVVSTVVATWLAYYVIKKRGMMPTQVE